jgi:Tfp pilus assembly protein FimT
MGKLSETLARMITNRVDYARTEAVERRWQIVMDEICDALRGDAQATDKEHHPEPTNEG